MVAIESLDFPFAPRHSLLTSPQVMEFAFRKKENRADRFQR
jgi:hypothetical protein